MSGVHAGRLSLRRRPDAAPRHAAGPPDVQPAGPEYPVEPPAGPAVLSPGTDIERALEILQLAPGTAQHVLVGDVHRVIDELIWAGSVLAGELRGPSGACASCAQGSHCKSCSCCVPVATAGRHAL